MWLGKCVKLHSREAFVLLWQNLEKLPTPQVAKLPNSVSLYIYSMSTSISHCPLSIHHCKPIAFLCVKPDCYGRVVPILSGSHRWQEEQSAGCDHSSFLNALPDPVGSDSLCPTAFLGFGQCMGSQSSIVLRHQVTIIGHKVPAQFLIVLYRLRQEQLHTAEDV